MMAVDLAAKLDHWVGSGWTTFDPTLVPLGSINMVRHGLTEEGTLGTHIDCEDEAPSQNIETMLKDSTRVLLTGELG
jgi:hypothetical protein